LADAERHADLGSGAKFLGMSEETLIRVYGHHHPDFQARGRRQHREEVMDRMDRKMDRFKWPLKKVAKDSPS
jgi:hypothetical protein